MKRPFTYNNIIKDETRIVPQFDKESYLRTLCAYYEILRSQYYAIFCAASHRMHAAAFPYVQLQLYAG